jgi:hypothetical protein
VRTAHVRFAALAALTAALCPGCKNDQPAAHSTQKPAATVTSPGATPRATVAPRRLTVTLMSARTSAGQTRVTYRPTRIQHVMDANSETDRLTVTGPPATLGLGHDARILLCTPLNQRDHGNVVVAEPVTVQTFVTALREQRSFLLGIGFEMRVGADSRITYLKQIFHP